MASKPERLRNVTRHHRSWQAKAGIASILALLLIAPVSAQEAGLNSVHDKYPEPVLSFDDEETATGKPDDSLAAAIAETLVSNPGLAARRYDLRATDDEIGIALSGIRPTARMQVSGNYDYILPGSITQAGRPLSDRLNDPHIQRNSVATQLVIDQPITTGGRVRGAVRAATAASAAGREVLRGAEGDLLVDLIAAYSDVRRDRRALSIRLKNLHILEETLDEIVARRDAGELTRTDIAQAETQLQAARVQRNSAEAQLEASIAAFVAIVGREPGKLAEEPALPGLPQSADAAFALAEAANPDLAAAIATERSSRARIAAARAEGNPQLSIQGIAGTNGPAVPFNRREHDVTFTGRATLSIPIVSGGRVRSLVAQAKNRQTADALRVEATHRQMVQVVINAWNQWVTADRNFEAQKLQLKAARIYYEGTYEEYREGLRSTFDVLYAQNSLRETEVALLDSKRDRYVAQAVLLRHLGKLEARQLLAASPVYDPADYTHRAARRGGLPSDAVFRAIDSIGAPAARPQRIDRPASVTDHKLLPPSTSDQPRDLIRHGGTVSEEGAQ
ncbi:TolC family outer membrane protein [Sphingopyxis indica]|uniref:TolC family outer membrane protein n=1 Tax=Sphingopyxis indica TaxID=436663 RepID=UPI0029390FD0|nr:TolC family outer membrane protein [Sphingopyxis indica]WOF43895.1 TolC family outer membrane protein [Sphingopyxis indica]